jgi:nicotinamidase-related amidase
MAPTLLLIDFQEEWRNKNSKYYLGNFEAKIINASQLLDHFHRNNWPVVITRHVEPGSADAFAEGTQRSEVISDLKVAESDRTIKKNRISPFYKTDLEKILRDVNTDKLVVAGIMTNLCVRSAVSDAYDRDFRIQVVTDACESGSAETDEFTFKDLKETRPEIEFVTTKQALSEK